MKGSELRELREKYGLLQAHVAEMFEVGRTTVIRWEAAEKLPRLAEYVVRSLSAEEGLASFVSTLDESERKAILRRGDADYYRRTRDVSNERTPAGIHDNFPGESLGTHPGSVHAPEITTDSELTIEDVARFDPDAPGGHLEIYDSGILPLDEYRRDVAPEVVEEPDYATGPLVEDFRKLIADKFRAGGRRAMMDLAFRTEVPENSLQAFASNLGELSMAEFGAVCRIIREAEKS